MIAVPSARLCRFPTLIAQVSTAGTGPQTGGPLPYMLVGDPSPDQAGFSPRVMVKLIRTL